jgi:hypothetical protein
MHSVQLHCAILAIARLEQQGLVVDVDNPQPGFLLLPLLLLLPGLQLMALM